MIKFKKIKKKGIKRIKRKRSYLSITFISLQCDLSLLLICLLVIGIIIISYY